MRNNIACKIHKRDTRPAPNCCWVSLPAANEKKAARHSCDLLDATGLRFMETTFPRTAPLTAIRSSAEAACLVHDKAMGRVGTFHRERNPSKWMHFCHGATQLIQTMQLGKSVLSDFLAADVGEVCLRKPGSISFPCDH